MACILVVDDEESICYAFSECITQMGHMPVAASNVKDALKKIRERTPEIVFLDNRLPGESGLSLLKKIQSMENRPVVVIMTAYGTMDTAIDAVKYGAFEYLLKPVDLTRIEEIVHRILHMGDSEAVHLTGESISEPDMAADMLIGSSNALSDIYKMIGLLTTNDVPVLIEGESGVGKELLARAIHNRSDRKGAPFVAVNCGAIPEHLIESELFGHEKEAYPGADQRKKGKFETARNGTLFLDDISRLNALMQIKLFQALQNKAIQRVGGAQDVSIESVRMITASDRRLLEEMKSGRFRSDLYYRLQLITLKIPPLRERRPDIPDLISHFIKKANLEMGLAVKGIEKNALDRLMEYDWPGNARELESVIKRGAILCRSETICAHHIELPDTAGNRAFENTESVSIDSQVTRWYEKRNQMFPGERKLFARIVSSVEKALIAQALEECGQNQLKASELLGMNRTTLRNKIKEFKI
ncbi:sigma-54-dependent transcriptional regulator [Desulfobacter curvatus]|uniref:sigma-54-dependent transcriptional regulator n=1 Tax=Desulfobacter curvatus TaxID=2290 RepID=UPI000377C229|nr:sigma-54 dependent transcriptional regulator [Desulfobacter curvatus]